MSATSENVIGLNGVRRPGRLRTLAALVAGFLTVVVTSVGTDAILHAAGIFPPLGERMSDAQFLLSLVYRLVYGVAGSYVAALLAPDRPMWHAMVLGYVGLVLSTLGAIAMWNAGPAWFSLGIIATAVPCAWLGGKLFERQAAGVR